MTNSAPQPPNPSAATSIFDDLAPHAQNIAYTLIGIGVALAFIPIVYLSRYGTNQLLVPVWGGLLALLFIGLGVWYRTMAHELHLGGADLLRLIALVVGGVGGCITALFGLALPVLQYSDEFSGGLQAWQSNRLPLSFAALAFLGGLVLMFLGLLQARAYERTQAALRRLLYGYNAVLGGLLLFCALALINVLAYSPVWPLSLLAKPLDMTRSGQFTLQPSTLKLLAALNKPLTIYVLLTDRDSLDEQTAVLLDQARSANGLISWQTVARDISPDKWRELEKTYKIPGGGMLLVYGSPPEEATEFVKLADLWNIKPRNDGSRQAVFQGEYALFGVLSTLYEGKSRPTIYFTQGNGELEMQGSGENRGLSMSMFIEALSKSNYELRPLPFDRKALEKSKSVPDDAAVVVIVGPRKPLTQEAVDALRKYVTTPRGSDNKKGKLIVMLDVLVNEQDNKMIQTNLEPLVREFNVEVGNNYVFTANFEEDHRKTLAITNDLSKTPIGTAFNDGREATLFFFYNARTVAPAKSVPDGRGSNAVAEVLLVTLPQFATWAETDLVTPADVILNKLKPGDRDIQQLPLAVTVSEPKMSAEQLPMGHPSTEQVSRMVVFGDARWLANSNEPKYLRRNVALVSSCLSWLRERPDIGPPPTPPTQPTFALTIPDVPTGRRLLFLPGALLLLGIVALGGGVWIVRRR